MTPTFRPARGLAVVAVTGAALTLAGCLSSTTYGTGEMPMASLMREMTGGLGPRRDQGPIDYHPRPPLVQPPQVALQPPVEAAEQQRADWPTDPRAVRTRRTVADADGDGNVREEFTSADARRMKAAAASQGRSGSSARQPHLRRANDPFEGNRNYDLGASDVQAIRQAAAQRQEEDAVGRRYLTDPPLVYRQPADTAPMPDAGKPAKKRWNPFGFLASRD